MRQGIESRQTMDSDFVELLDHLEDGDRPLSAVRARIATGRPLTAIDEIHLAQVIASDGDVPAPDPYAPLLVILTDRRLLVGQAKRTFRRKSGTRVLGEVPLDRIEEIEPRKIEKVGWSGRPYIFLALLSMALLFVLFELENTLPSSVWWSLIIAVGVVNQGAAYGMLAGDYVHVEKHNFDVEVNLSNGKSILFRLYRGPNTDSFLSAFRAVS